MTPNESERVVVVAPYGRDAEMTTQLLERSGLSSVICDDMQAVGARLPAADVGALVVAEEALMPRLQLEAFSHWLEGQGTWSDIPIIVLSSERGAYDSRLPPPVSLRRFNITILERPVAVHTLIAAVEVALRARRRQYQVRSLLEQREALADLEKQARLRAESASRAKDEFLAMLGHELRNPLSPIVTALHLIRQRQPSGCDHELTVIERQVDHVARLVDDLLDVSRITQGKIETKSEPIAIQGVVARAVEMASPLFEARRHALQLDVAPDLVVLGDDTRLAQVFANLLTNAAKYTPPRGHIALTAKRDADDVVIAVRDDGAGIAREMLPHVFEMFVQEKQTIDRSAGGLGLGLTIVRSLVQIHGGTVAVTSDGLGHGSVFTVRLPLSKVRAAPALAKPAPAAAAAKRVEHPRILVVDDNEDAAEMLAFALEASGYSTRVAHDGVDALRVADEFAPALAVLDIGLPVMDGYELARRLKLQRPDMPLVALTGYGQADDARRAREAGFDEHLVKPVDLERLNATVSRFIAKDVTRASA